MLLLSRDERALWKRLGEDALARNGGPDGADGGVRVNLLPLFRFYVGALMTAQGRGKMGMEWLKAGTLGEEEGLFSNAFLLGFLGRHEQRLAAPDVCFKDPRPFLHFAGVPMMRQSRRNFVKTFVDAMPVFRRPFRMMDIGCGDGGLTAWVLREMRRAGKIGDVGEVLLVDASKAMVELARETVGKEFPPNAIQTVNSRIENCSDQIRGRYDVALCSLSYHHMPLEVKRRHLERLRERFDHFVIFELDANNDTPEVFSPELAVSVYQSYGRITDFVYAHDAPVEVAQACVDCFLMTEEISFMTQPRGARSDYHMMRGQWRDLFDSVLGDGFERLCDATAYADEYVDLFTLHYGRK